MNETLNLNNYDHKSYQYFPRILWRVEHSATQSLRNLRTGDLIASDDTRTFSDEAALRQAVEAHFDWGNRQQSCFLSVFSDEQHARNWMKQRESSGTGLEVYIYKIDTARLPDGVYAFTMDVVRSKIGIVNPPSNNDEVLFLHRIPGRAVVSKQSLGEIEELEADAEEYANRSRHPDGYHWDSELWGWYDTDEEVEERNMSDDLMKML